MKMKGKLGPIMVAVIVCVCTALGFGTVNYLQGGLINTPVEQAVEPSGILYHVLEIEPCRDYLYDENTNKDAIASALGVSRDKISFKYVDTAEFNGMNEDLVATYDLIVIGDKTGRMCKDSTGKTIYNDTSLDGYIYLAYGDLVKYDDRMAGMLPYDYYSEKTNPDDYIPVDSFINGEVVDGYTLSWSDSAGGKTIEKQSDTNNFTTNWKSKYILYSNTNTKVWYPGMQSYFGGEFYILKSINSTSWSNVTDFYNDALGNARLTGNDITEKKLNELLDYVRTGRPVVLANNLYTCVSDNNTSANSNKTAYPTSNVYSFLSSVNGMANIVKYSNISSNLKDAMHDVVLEIVDYSIKYQNSSNEWVNAPNITYTGSLVSDDCMVYNVEQFRYTVKFNAVAGKQYYVKLIVDKNTDGRFNSVPSVDDFNEVYYVAIIDAEADTVSHTLDINLPKDYNGMFGWQILVEELDAYKNPIDRVSVDGRTVVKGETKVVKALQLLPNGDGQLNMKTHGTFTTQMSNATDAIGYSVTVDTMKVDDFEKEFIGKPYTKGTSYKQPEDYLKSNDYNMLIIGFVDSYAKEDISDDNGALSCVMDFMENGNSVLFSHDTMQFQPSANMGIAFDSISTTTQTTNTYRYCTNHNQREGHCRGWGGHRYENRTETVGDNTKTLKLKLTSGYNERAGYIMTLGMRKFVGMDRYSATTIPSYTDPVALEAANVPKKVDGNYITEIQGFSDWFLLWMNKCTTYKTSRDGTNIITLVPDNELVNDGIGGLNDKTRTKTVDEINEGQITMFPYKVTNTGQLSVAETHSQYYQVDLNEEDLVVWYTLAETFDEWGNSKYGAYYGTTAKDAANNYYIYSKGNITYTGAGHASISGTDEVRLFVNTVIRAASAGNFVPVVKSINGANTHIPDSYVVFPKPYDDKYLVQFEAYDEDLATLEVIKHSYPEAQWNEHIGRFSAGAVYWVDSAGNERLLKTYSRTNSASYLLNGETTDFWIYDPTVNYDDIDNAIDGKTMAQVNSDTYLKNMYDCFTAYKEEGEVNLKITASDYQGETGSCVIAVTNQELFNLD